MKNKDEQNIQDQIDDSRKQELKFNIIMSILIGAVFGAMLFDWHLPIPDPITDFFNAIGDWINDAYF